MIAAVHSVYTQTTHTVSVAVTEARGVRAWLAAVVYRCGWLCTTPGYVYYVHCFGCGAAAFEIQLPPVIVLVHRSLFLR